MITQNSKDQGQEPSVGESHRRKNQSVIHSGGKPDKKSRHGKGRNAYYNETVGKARPGVAAPRRQLLDTNLFQLQNLNILPPLLADSGSKEQQQVQAERSVNLPNIQGGELSHDRLPSDFASQDIMSDANQLPFSEFQRNRAKKHPT